MKLLLRSGAFVLVLLFVSIGIVGLACSNCLEFTLPFVWIHWVSSHVTIGMDAILAAAALWAIAQLCFKKETGRIYYLLVIIAAVLLIGIDVSLLLLPHPRPHIGIILTTLNYILPLLMCWGFYQIWRGSESEN